MVATAALLLPASSPAAPGSLDRSFNGTGRLLIPATKRTVRIRNDIEVTRLEGAPTLSAPGPGGELLIANDRRLLSYRDGRRRNRFGANGRARIPTPPGMSFQLAGLAVDSRGRILVAGTTSPPGATGGSQDARASVYRFMPMGKLDRRFGEGRNAGAALGPMEASGLTVDSRDRPVLTGFSALTPSSCNTTAVYLNTTVVARLTAGGAPDPTFGGGSGIFTDPLEDPHLPTLAPSGELVYASSPMRRCAGFDGYPPVGASPMTSILSPSGGLAFRFPVRPSGPSLPALAPLLEVTSLAVDRENRIVILMTAYPPEAGGILQVVCRLLPDGSPDSEFGRPSWEGEPGCVGVPPGLPGGSRFGALTTDARNRIILAGSFERREGRFVSRGFLAVRLKAVGTLQTRFGQDGATKVRFGKRTEATPTQVYLDSRGRIVIGGTVEGLWPSTGYELAFARLLSGGR